ncbi:F-box/WD repeat-containing protein [Endozoicomonas sp. YOMI1]|uniref:F-box/WD repeat-containing protein n=1 Tax=Endozoicomonas sp. YOMI1 TaxID=2828739 RepID=UPI0021487B8F|nr:F-box/WD repeat-containing protein [Endozoicomonas sp. YOMI1]
MVPGWPVNQPARSTPSNSPSTIALPKSSPQKQPLWQRRITELPPELLVLIFDYLEFDDIRRVNETCLAFREVVKEYNYIQELSFFARLPRCFREQYQQTAPWQKKSLRSHPFTTSAPLNDKVIPFRDRIIKNLPQMAALLCLGTLGKMERCPAYRPVERYKVTLPLSEARYREFHPDPAYDICFSPSGRHLLFYGRCLNGCRILAKDDQGQWAEEHQNWFDNSDSRVIITGASFSACGNRLLIRSAEGCVNTLRPTNRCWNDFHKETLPDQTVKFSPSGKYMVTYGSYHPVSIWLMGGNNKWLEMEVLDLSPGVLVNEVLFSPSEQYVLLRRPDSQVRRGKMTMLSLDYTGVWSGQPLNFLKKELISYARFSQVADQLLVGVREYRTKRGRGRGRVSIYSPEPSGKWEETVIYPYCYPLGFSPAGKYVYSSFSISGRDVQLWRRPEKLSDWSLNHCRLPQLDDASRARLDSVILLKHDSRVDTALFNPSDSHLLVCCRPDTVHIWGKNQAGEWSIQTTTRECAPTTTPCFSLSGLHALTCNPHMVGILGRNNQQHWSLKGVIKQDGILKAYFNPISEHEVVVLSRTTDGDITNITLQVWEIRDAGTPD